MKAIETFMSSNVNTIDDSILWSCLDDDADDDVLLEHIQNLKPREIAKGEKSLSNSRASMIIRLRRNIIRYLQQNIIKMNSNTFSRRMLYPDEMLRQPDSVSLRCISRIFSMTVSLSIASNKISKVRRTIWITFFSCSEH
jgi:hypothetical protein